MIIRFYSLPTSCQGECLYLHKPAFLPFLPVIYSFYTCTFCLPLLAFSMEGKDSLLLPLARRLTLQIYFPFACLSTTDVYTHTLCLMQFVFPTCLLHVSLPACLQPPGRRRQSTHMVFGGCLPLHLEGGALPACCSLEVEQGGTLCCCFLCMPYYLLPFLPAHYHLVLLVIYVSALSIHHSPAFVEEGCGVVILFLAPRCLIVTAGGRGREGGPR